MDGIKVDFSGYVTKNDLRCTDGRTIVKNSFQHQDGNIVPLVWQHLHNDPGNVIGKMYLENREDGVYGYGSLNHTEKAENARELLRHGDVDSMSIYATNLIERGGNVMHGDIKEVSLVLSGANPGAKIEHISLAHGDGTFDDIEDEAVIHHSGVVDNFGDEDMYIDLYDENGDMLSHADEEEDEEDESDDETIGDVFNTLSDKQKNVVYAMIGMALEDKGSGDNSMKQSDEGGTIMKMNAFETFGTNKSPDGQIFTDTGKVLSHSDIQDIATKTFAEAQQLGSFRKALQHAAGDYGISNISVLFPDAKAVNDRPEFVNRRSEWVSQVLNGTKHVPFSRIKSVFADITADEARAKGYVKGSKKVEEVFPVLKRITTPQTIYKLQKLDRDDILDITDFDVVAWLRQEMRMMLDEEIARAILIGDGRLVTASDKINETNVRPIWTDDDFYSYHLKLAASRTDGDLVDAFVRARLHYEGAGNPVAFMSPESVTDMLLTKDKDGYRMYKTEAELLSALRVSKIIEVPQFYGLTRTDSTDSKTYGLDGIIVNLSDYSVGADKGGQVTNMDDFDIDYNQYKYLIETRISGALTAYHSAVVIETNKTASSGGTGGNG